MKNLGRILSLSLLIVLLSCSLSFAAGLELIDSYPPDGGDGFHPENVVVKLYFNEDVSAKEVQDANQNAFKFTDEKGKSLPLKVLYSEKDLDQIWVMVDQSLESDKPYKLEISGTLQIPNGDTLGENKTIEFRTRNTSSDTTGYMAIMGIMVVGMVLVTSISTKRAMKKEAAQGEASKINPYKMAKETGKSVEEIVAKTEKEKEKQKAKAESHSSKKGNRGSKNADSAKDQREAGDTKKVKAVRPISATGSTFITGRKAEAELKAAEAARKAATTTTNPKRATGKSKNTKGKKR